MLCLFEGEVSRSAGSSVRTLVITVGISVHTREQHWYSQWVHQYVPLYSVAEKEGVRDIASNCVVDFSLRHESGIGPHLQPNLNKK